MSKEKFTKEMTIGEALEVNPKAEVVLMGFGMHCCGCPVSQMETLEEAASVHEADIDEILTELNNMNDKHTCSCGCGEEDCFCDEDEDGCDCGCDCGCEDEDEEE